MKSVKCVSCNKVKEFDKNINGGSIVNKMNATGFNPVMNLECKIDWLCPECYKKASNLAKQLIDMFNGEKNISLGCIFRK